MSGFELAVIFLLMVLAVIAMLVWTDED